jgi:hypothetical protein
MCIPDNNTGSAPPHFVRFAQECGNLALQNMVGRQLLH